MTECFADGNIASSSLHCFPSRATGLGVVVDEQFVLETAVCGYFKLSLVRTIQGKLSGRVVSLTQSVARANDGLRTTCRGPSCFWWALGLFQQGHGVAVLVAHLRARGKGEDVQQLGGEQPCRPSQLQHQHPYARG